MKKIFNILLTISLMFLILVITLKISIVENISKTLTKNDISEYIIDFIKKEFSSLDSLTLDRIEGKLINDSSLDEISDYIFNMLLNDLKNGTTSEIYLDDMLEEVINKNISYIPIQLQKQFETSINNLDFNKLYSELLQMIRYKLGDKFIQFIKIYDAITSDSVISLLITLIILSIFIIVWKNKSIVDFLHDIGMTLLIDGGIMMVIMFVSKRILSMISAIVSIKIDLNIFIILSFIFLVLGFILTDVDLKKEKKR